MFSMSLIFILSPRIVSAINYTLGISSRQFASKQSFNIFFKDRHKLKLAVHLPKKHCTVSAAIAAPIISASTAL